VPKFRVKAGVMTATEVPHSAGKKFQVVADARRGYLEVTEVRSPRVNVRGLGCQHGARRTRRNDRWSSGGGRATRRSPSL
jgi:hypothetical protein